MYRTFVFSNIKPKYVFKERKGIKKFMATYNGFKSIEGKEFYERTLMHALKENNILLQFAKKSTLPKNHGDTITWRKRKPVPVQVDGNGKVRKLTEGVTPTPNRLEFVEYKATIAEYGDWIKLTKKLSNLAIDPILTEASEGLGESAGDTFDKAIKEVLYANPNVYYAGNKTSTTIAATDYLTIADFNRIKATFKKRNVKPFEDGFYVLIITPEVEYDLKSNTTVNASWIDISKYSDAERKNIVKGEIGRLFGFKVIVYNKLDAATGLGAGESPNVSAFKCLAFGKDAFGTVDLEGNSAAAPTVFYNAPGKVGNDPLKQRHSVAWKNEGWTARIIYPEALTVVYAPSSLSISDYTESSSDVNYYNNTGVAGPNSFQAYEDYTSGQGLDNEH